MCMAYFLSLCKLGSRTQQDEKVLDSIVELVEPRKLLRELEVNVVLDVLPATASVHGQSGAETPNCMHSLHTRIQVDERQRIP